MYRTDRIAQRAKYNLLTEATIQALLPGTNTPVKLVPLGKGRKVMFGTPEMLAAARAERHKQAMEDRERRNQEREASGRISFYSDIVRQSANDIKKDMMLKKRAETNERKRLEKEALRIEAEKKALEDKERRQNLGKLGAQKRLENLAAKKAENELRQKEIKRIISTLHGSDIDDIHLSSTEVDELLQLPTKYKNLVLQKKEQQQKKEIEAKKRQGYQQLLNISRDIRSGKYDQDFNRAIIDASGIFEQFPYLQDKPGVPKVANPSSRQEIENAFSSQHNNLIIRAIDKRHKILDAEAEREVEDGIRGAIRKAMEAGKISKSDDIRQMFATPSAALRLLGEFFPPGYDDGKKMDMIHRIESRFRKNFKVDKKTMQLKAGSFKHMRKAAPGLSGHSPSSINATRSDMPMMARQAGVDPSVLHEPTQKLALMHGATQTDMQSPVHGVTRTDMNIPTGSSKEVDFDTWKNFVLDAGWDLSQDPRTYQWHAIDPKRREEYVYNPVSEKVTKLSGHIPQQSYQDKLDQDRGYLLDQIALRKAQRAGNQKLLPDFGGAKLLPTPKHSRLSSTQSAPKVKSGKTRSLDIPKKEPPKPKLEKDKKKVKINVKKPRRSSKKESVMNVVHDLLVENCFEHYSNVY